MQRAAALLLALLCCAFAQNACNRKFTCVGEGTDCTFSTSCGLNGNAACPLCKNSACVNNVCVAGADLGETCAANGPICTRDAAGIAHDKYYIFANTCLNGKCGTNDNPLFPGDSCSKSDSLIQDSSTTGGCAVGTCGTTCSSTAAGASCNGTVPCAQGYYCSIIDGDSPSNATCVAWKTEGANCDTGICAPNLVCHLTSNGATTSTCISLFSIAKGSFCMATALGPVGEDAAPASTVCNKGLTCSATSGGSFPTCQDPDDKPVGKTCTGASDCSPSELYACVPDSCDGTSHCERAYIRSSSSVAGAYESYVDCLTNNKCASPVPWQSGSGGNQNCANQNCFSQWKSLVDKAPYVFGDCGAASGLVPVAVLALAALLAMLL
jgi:hypothetical protein